jgi:outer membrane murein-binding lipoprotein Lpp
MGKFNVFMSYLVTLMVVAFVGVCLCVSLHGCSTIHIPATATTPARDTTALQEKLTSDLNQAILDAEAAKDPMAPQRAICYKTILSFVPAIPTLSGVNLGKSAGVFDTFEHTAELAENAATVAEFQIPPEVRVKLLTDCGPLQAAANDLLLKFNIRLVRAAGAIAILPK